MGYKIIVIISSAIALICTYLVYMAFVAADHVGMLVFAAFGLMFAALPIEVIGRMLTRKKFPWLYDRIVSKAPQRTVFVPHWQLMGMIALAVLIILLAILIPMFNQ